MPPPTCNPGPLTPFPAVRAEVCGEAVCLSPADTTAIWEWAREVGRWADRAALCFTGPAKTAAEWKDTAGLMPLALQLAHPRVRIRVRVADERQVPDCSEPNAFYYPGAETIVICTKLVEHVPPVVVRGFLAHEIAHAYIHQLRLPVVGSIEAAADELGAVLLLANGRTAEIDGLINYWAQQTGAVPGWVDHPTYDQRYHRLRCLRGKPTVPTCSWLRDPTEIVETWTRLLLVDWTAP